MTDTAVEAQKNQVKVLNTVAGTNTITGSMSPALGAYSAGMTVAFNPANTNTGATTININSLGALDVFRYGGEALLAGDLVAGIPAHLILDSGADDFYLLNPQNTGFRNIPVTSLSGNVTFALTDSGKGYTAGGAGGYTWTIPANASIAFPVGTVITLNNQSSGNVTIAITSDTLVLAGAGTTGSRTLATNGVATLWKISSTTWIINGAGLS